MIPNDARTDVVIILLDKASELLEATDPSPDDTQWFREAAAALWRQAIIAASELEQVVEYALDSEHGEFHGERVTRRSLSLVLDTRVHKSNHSMVQGSVSASFSRFTDPDNVTWWLAHLEAKNLRVTYESLHKNKTELCMALFLNVVEDLAKGN